MSSAKGKKEKLVSKIYLMMIRTSDRKKKKLILSQDLRSGGGLESMLRLSRHSIKVNCAQTN